MLYTLWPIFSFQLNSCNWRMCDDLQNCSLYTTEQLCNAKCLCFQVLSVSLWEVKMNKWNMFRSRINKPGLHSKVYEIWSTNPVAQEARKMSSFVPEVPLVTEGAMEFKRKLSLCRKTEIHKKPHAAGSYKSIPKRDYKRRIQKRDWIKKKIQPEMPDSVNFENWDWIQLPD